MDHDDLAYQDRFEALLSQTNNTCFDQTLHFKFESVSVSEIQWKFTEFLSVSPLKEICSVVLYSVKFREFPSNLRYSNPNLECTAFVDMKLKIRFDQFSVNVRCNGSVEGIQCLWLRWAMWISQLKCCWVFDSKFGGLNGGGDGLSQREGRSRVRRDQVQAGGYRQGRRAGTGAVGVRPAPYALHRRRASPRRGAAPKGRRH